MPHPLLHTPLALPAVRLRWLIRRDCPEVLTIEELSFRDPWSEEKLCGWLRQRNCIGLTAEDASGRVLGHLVYSIERTRLVIRRLAVHPDFRRQGIGRLMMDRLTEELRDPQNRVVVDIPEWTDWWQFFKGTGFRAVSRGGVYVVGEWYRFVRRAGECVGR